MTHNGSCYRSCDFATADGPIKHLQRVSKILDLEIVG